ncbi:hypothetical protein [Stutzerimonas chloritidismutans]|uniref:hypothetical protein n=1 Tax=Stutzerimonas chloritidismutans TaxID=203192 RepID=UPI003F5CCDD5
MSLQIDMSGLASLAWLLNSMALLIALAGSWLLVATRWRRQLSGARLHLAESRVETSTDPQRLGTGRVDRFFYAFGFASLGLAWLLSTATRLV